VKVVKPQKVGLLTRSFEFGRDFFFAVAAVVFFPLEDPRRLLTEVDLWKFVPGELGKGAVLDACMPKSRGEFLVTGRAFPSGGQPAAACAPRVQIGSVSKSLLVVGNRTWKQGAMTVPEPFLEMPISWENAFGGPDYKLNPLGKGAAPIDGLEGKVHPLPNVEDPARRMKSHHEKPTPVGFGPYDFTWPQRFKKVGTYDKKWLKERFPGYAADVDWTLFNTAPEDQWVEGFFKGDEPFTLDFMHRTKARIEGQLPGATTRCFVNVKTDAGEEFREIATKLDTVWFFPHAERGVLVFHGSTKVAQDDVSDVLQIVAACEEMGSPRPVEHYQRVLAERLDKEKGVLAGLRDSDLLPDWPNASAPIHFDDMQAIVSENLLAKNMRKGFEREREQNRAMLVALGVDPAPFEIPPLPDTESPANMEDDLQRIEKLKEEAEQLEKKRDQEAAEHEEAVRRDLVAQGIDPEPVIERLRHPPGGPPKFSAEEELQKLRGIAEQVAAAGQDPGALLAMASDPEYQKQLVEGEARIRDLYRMSAHLAGPVGALSQEASARIRDAVIAAVQAGESFDARDLTGADLSGIQLPGARLAGAFLEGANLAGADLSGADLSGAVLARADLSGTNLRGACLKGANLGGAKLADAVIAEANLENAILYKANLGRADLQRARLSGANLVEAECMEANLSGIQAAQLFFYKTDLSRLQLTGADLTKCVFLEVKADGADFSDACLESAVFLEAVGQGALFRRARATNLRLVKECRFEDADFGEAVLDGANFRGSHLARSSFSRARLNGADLSECDLQHAHLDRAVGRDLRLTKADLTEAFAVGADLLGASLMTATIQGADFRGANLYRADFARVLTDDRVKLTEANLKYVRVDPKRAR
jgi:uncharacterized protein YjbI with pentapeptide repeats